LPIFDGRLLPAGRWISMIRFGIHRVLPTVLDIIRARNSLSASETRPYARGMTSNRQVATPKVDYGRRSSGGRLYVARMSLNYIVRLSNQSAMACPSNFTRLPTRM
jgi:hypothetical protein